MEPTDSFWPRQKSFYNYEQKVKTFPTTESRTNKSSATQTNLPGQPWHKEALTVDGALEEIENFLMLSIKQIMWADPLLYNGYQAIFDQDHNFSVESLKATAEVLHKMNPKNIPQHQYNQAQLNKDSRIRDVVFKLLFNVTDTIIKEKHNVNLYSKEGKDRSLRAQYYEANGGMCQLNDNTKPKPQYYEFINKRATEILADYNINFDKNALSKIAATIPNWQEAENAITQVKSYLKAIRSQISNKSGIFKKTYTPIYPSKQELLDKLQFYIKGCNNLMARMEIMKGYLEYNGITAEYYKEHLKQKGQTFEEKLQKKSGPIASFVAKTPRQQIRIMVGENRPMNFTAHKTVNETGDKQEIAML